MESFIALLIPALLGVILLRLLVIPMGFLLKAAVHGAGGFLCLWLLNTVSFYTGVCIPINTITISVAGFLGIPGILLLAGLELMG